MKLTDIYIYPVKSLGGIKLEHARVEPQGLAYDRKWMIVDDVEYKHLTQRQIPEMALLQVQLLEDRLEIRHKHKDMTPLAIPLSLEGSEILEISVWNDWVPSLRVGEVADHWLNDALGTSCRLVYMHNERSRSVKPKYAPEGSWVSYADRTPFMILGKESLEDLNNRLETPLPINRFRPNFVFEGGKPYEEDHWKRFSIGDATFHGAGPCGRCKITTIDQETGDRGEEPLKTLSTYRKPEKSVLFGLLSTWESGVEVSVGDAIQIHK